MRPRRECLGNHRQSVRNTGGKYHSPEVMGRNKGYILGWWSKGNPCYTVVQKVGVVDGTN